MMEIWSESGELTTIAQLNEHGEIEIHQNFEVTEPANLEISNTVFLSTVNLSEILSAAIGKTIGKVSRQELHFSMHKDQLYAFLREHIEVIQQITKNSEYAEAFLRNAFVYPQAEREEPHEEFHYAKPNEDVVKLIRSIAAAVSCELIDREPEKLPEDMTGY